MGIVSKQGFYNTIAGYLGIAIGYVNTVLLFPHILDADQYGLTRIILAAATVFAQFSQLGISNITIKFFPSFRDKEARHHGVFFFVLLIPILGFLIFSVIALIFKQEIIDIYSNGAVDFVENFNYVFIAAFFLILFSVVDAYMRALFKSVPAYLLNNVVLRVLWLLLIIGYSYELYNFETFLFWFIFSYAIILFLLLLSLLKTRQVKLIPDMKAIRERNISNVFKYGVFSFLSSGSMFLATRIDVLMIGALIVGTGTGESLDEVAIYSVAFYIASIIAVPFLSMTTILSVVISEALEKKDWVKLDKVYKQSSESLMIIGCLIFLGIWLNVDNLLQLLPPEYASGKYVILLIGLARLFSVITGINAQVIQYSDHYKFILISNIIFVALIIASNAVFIPLYGLEGAAFATFLSIILYNSIKTGFIWVKMNMLPLRSRSLLTLLIGGLTYGVVYSLPQADNYLVDMVIKSVSIVGIYVPLIYFLRVSEEINSYIRKGFGFIGIRLP